MPRRFPRCLSLAVSACLLAGSAQAQAMLPPNLASEADDLAGFGEPPLWAAPAAAAGYRQRLRLVLAGPFRDRVAIRIDTDLAGRSQAHFARQALVHGRWRITQRRRRDVPAPEVEDLDRKIAGSRLWKIYPEFWQARGSDSVCVDGVYVILERVTAAGYRFSESNAQCTAPSDVLQVAAQMIDMGDPGDARVASWLH